MRGLYVHIPFCTSKCHYCNFVITTQAVSSAFDAFAGCFEKEVTEARARYGRLEFDTLYFGGGTPSLLDESQLDRIWQVLDRTFDLTRVSEVTLEANPGDMDASKIRYWFRRGVNRVSIGVQSTHERHLERMGRKHSVCDARVAVRQVRENGFNNVSVDLISRLPDLTLDEWTESLETVAAWEPSQVVIYDLNIHEGTAFGAWVRKGSLPLPSEAHHHRMSEITDEVLMKHGFSPYEILSYAKPGFESRHNLIYWKNEEYLGLGPGAFSYMKGRRYQFARSVLGYLKKIQEEDWEADEEETLTPAQREIETALTGLRLLDGIDLNAYSLIRKHLENEVQPLVQSGLLEFANGRVRLSARGRRIPETIFTQLSL